MEYTKEQLDNILIKWANMPIVTETKDEFESREIKRMQLLKDRSDINKKLNSI